MLKREKNKLIPKFWCHMFRPVGIKVLGKEEERGDTIDPLNW